MDRTIPDLRTLSITFGGLCMLVQSKEPQGFFVLLPNLQREHMVHCPMLNCEPTYDDDGHQGFRMPLDQQIVNLGWLADHREPPKFTDKVANVSRAAGGIAVARHWLTDRTIAPHDCLGARIDLPLGATVEELGDPAMIRVPIPNAGYITKDLRGLVRVSVKEVRPHLTGIQIGNHKIVPNADGAIELQVLNVRPADMDGKPRHHEVRERIHHIQAYYWLLEGYCRNHIEGRYFTVGKKQDSNDRTDEKDYPCPPAVRGEIRISYVDPYNCTIGAGCPPNSPQC